MTDERTGAPPPPRRARPTGARPAASAPCWSVRGSAARRAHCRRPWTRSFEVGWSVGRASGARWFPRRRPGSRRATTPGDGGGRPLEVDPADLVGHLTPEDRRARRSPRTSGWGRCQVRGECEQLEADPGGRGRPDRPAAARRGPWSLARSSGPDVGAISRPTATPSAEHEQASVAEQPAGAVPGLHAELGGADAGLTGRKITRNTAQYPRGRSVLGEQRVDELVGVEVDEVVGRLAEADELDRDAERRTGSRARCRPWPSRRAW